MARGKRVHQPLKKVRITAVRQTVYPDLMAQYENPIEHACTIHEGQEWVSIDAQCPEGLCAAAWASMREFVAKVAEELPNEDFQRAAGLGAQRVEGLLEVVKKAYLG